MTSGSDPVQKILRLFVRGENDKALSLLQKERDRLEAEIRPYQEQLDRIKDLLAEAEGAPPKTKRKVTKKKRGKKKKSSRSSMTLSQKRRRRQEVLGVAQKVAQIKHEFTTDDVRAAVEEEGIEMGVSSSRMNTTIGNILKHFSDFEQVETGVFRMPHGRFNFYKETEPS